MPKGRQETLIQRLTACIQEQLLVNGITDFTIADGNFYFANPDEKTKANVIIRDYLTYMLANHAERLI